VLATGEAPIGQDCDPFPGQLIHADLGPFGSLQGERDRRMGVEGVGVDREMQAGARDFLGIICDADGAALLPGNDQTCIA